MMSAVKDGVKATVNSLFTTSNMVHDKVQQELPEWKVPEGARESVTSFVDLVGLVFFRFFQSLFNVATHGWNTGIAGYQATKALRNRQLPVAKEEGKKVLKSALFTIVNLGHFHLLLTTPGLALLEAGAYTVAKSPTLYQKYILPQLNRF